MAPRDYLSEILERKRRENHRRGRHGVPAALVPVPDRGSRAIAQLRRAPGQVVPRVIAEIKMRSPSAGSIHAPSPGEVARIAASYTVAGAAAVSVLCDRTGFGGSPLDVRRARAATELPLLYKEFVLDPLQVPLAQSVGASMVLLLVRALPGGALPELVECVAEHGMAPVVEAADAHELERALDTRASIVGINARDLRTFKVDSQAAELAVASIPAERVAVHMSGVRTAEDLRRIGASRADAVLVGESLMRAGDPGAQLAQLLASAQG